MLARALARPREGSAADCRRRPIMISGFALQADYNNNAANILVAVLQRKGNPRLTPLKTSVACNFIFTFPDTPISHAAKKRNAAPRFCQSAPAQIVEKHLERCSRIPRKADLRALYEAKLRTRLPRTPQHDELSPSRGRRLGFTGGIAGRLTQVLRATWH